MSHHFKTPMDVAKNKLRSVIFQEMDPVGHNTQHYVTLTAGQELPPTVTAGNLWIMRAQCGVFSVPS